MAVVTVSLWNALRSRGIPLRKYIFGRICPPDRCSPERQHMPTKLMLLSTKLLAIAGATQMTANDINDHGQVVGQFTDSRGVAHGFLYEEESYCQIDYPAATETNLLGINNLGQIVGMFTG